MSLPADEHECAHDSADDDEHGEHCHAPLEPAHLAYGRLVVRTHVEMVRREYGAPMTTSHRTAALLALTVLVLPAVALAEGDDCPPTTTVPSTTVPVPDTTVPAPTTTVVPEPVPTTLPDGPGYADPIPGGVYGTPETDVCLDPNGDGVGATAWTFLECYTTPEAAAWTAVVDAMVLRYGITRGVASALLAALLTR